MAAGGLLVAAGVLGFVPGVTTHVGSLAFAGHGSRAELLGQFRVSVLLNLVHIASGLPAAVLARTEAGARSYLTGCGSRVSAALGARAAEHRRLGSAEHRRQLAPSRLRAASCSALGSLLIARLDRDRWLVDALRDLLGRVDAGELGDPLPVLAYLAGQEVEIPDDELNGARRRAHAARRRRR